MGTVCLRRRRVGRERPRIIPSSSSSSSSSKSLRRGSLPSSPSPWGTAPQLLLDLNQPVVSLLRQQPFLFLVERPSPTATATIVLLLRRRRQVLVVVGVGVVGVGG